MLEALLWIVLGWFGLSSTACGFWAALNPRRSRHDRRGLASEPARPARRGLCRDVSPRVVRTRSGPATRSPRGDLAGGGGGRAPRGRAGGGGRGPRRGSPPAVPHDDLVPRRAQRRRRRDDICRRHDRRPSSALPTGPAAHVTPTDAAPARGFRYAAAVGGGSRPRQRVHHAPHTGV